MRHWQAILAVSAVAAISGPAGAAERDVYVAIARSDEMIILIQTPGDLQQSRSKTHAMQFAYYAEPSFSMNGVPIRMTKTEFEVDCDNGATRRLKATAYRDIGDRVGEESYSDGWVPIEAAGDPMDNMRRLVCVGLGPNDVTFSNLGSAVSGFEGAFRSASAD